jgi:hypothetical protein
MVGVIYSNPRLEAVIENWPLGRNKRGPAKFTIERHPQRGERAIRETTTGAPKKMAYAKQMRIVDGDDGRTYVAWLRGSYIEIRCGDMRYKEINWAENPRYSMALALFGNSHGASNTRNSTAQHQRR